MKASNIRRIAIGAAAGLLVLVALAWVAVRAGDAGRPPAPAYWPTGEWRQSTPEEQGFDSARLAEGLRAIRGKGIRIHSLTLIRHGRVLLGASFYPYDGAIVHDLASVTKSVTTALIAIAADQGKLRLDQPMLSFFPGRAIANRDARKERITVRHLAGMCSGLDCTAAHDEQTLTEMQASPDWVQFMLDRRMVDEPGARFEYSSPGMHMLSAILQQATGMSALEFARVNLFEPLGIREAVWKRQDPRGYNDGWGGLYLHPRDAAKLGFLWLHGGRWEGRQIVPRRWVEESVRRQIRTGGGDDYGYGWWVPRGEQPEYAAVGRGGQYIRVFPGMDTIVVTTGGGFDWNEVTPMLVRAIGDMRRPLPANPAGLAELRAALAEIRQPPAPRPPAPLPPTARAVTGRTFDLAPNPLRLETLRLDFDGSAQARLAVTLAGQPEQQLAVGLDGVYRMQPSDFGLPLGLRGEWVDGQTFLLEYDRIANNDSYSLRLHFTADRLTIEAAERTREAGVRLEGRARGPQRANPRAAGP